MEVTTITAVAAQNALQQFNSTKFPMKLSVRLAKIQKELNTIGDAYNERRNELIQKYRDKKAKGPAQVSADKIQDFTDELKLIGEETVEVEIEPIAMKDIPDDHEVEPNVLVALDWIIEA